MNKQWIRRSLVMVPIVIAVVVLTIAPKLKKPPVRTEVEERALKVRAIQVPAVALAPRAVGYGTTTPARHWEAVAEVAGQVSWISDALKSGRIVPAGTDLLQIDDASYQLALTQAETQLQALEVRDSTTRASLVLEEEGQALLDKDFARKSTLQKQGAISSSDFEAAQRSRIQGQAKVQGLLLVFLAMWAFFSLRYSFWVSMGPPPLFGAPSTLSGGAGETSAASLGVFAPFFMDLR